MGFSITRESTKDRVTILTELWTTALDAASPCER